MKKVFAGWKGYFTSWYGNIWMLLLMAAVSAFSITFYTTKFPLLRSDSTEHYTVLLSSFVLMLLLTAGIGFIFYKVRRHAADRLIYPLGVSVSLVALLPFVVLKVVYAVYDWVFHIDLSKTDYVERDFVVVMFCMFAILCYYSIRELMQFARRERDKLREAQAEAHALKQESLSVGQTKKKLSKLQSLADQLTQPIAVHLEDGLVVDAYMPQVCGFFIAKAFAGQKIVTVQLLDGRKGDTTESALSAIMKKYPLLCCKVSRSALVSLLAIQSIEKAGEEVHLRLNGENQGVWKIPHSALHEVETAYKLLQELIPQEAV